MAAILILFYFIALVNRNNGFLTNIPQNIFLSSLSSTSLSSINSGSLDNFLKDAESIGNVRFVVVGEGSILEAVGSFQNLRYADTATRGKLATVSGEDPCFECHLNVDKVIEVHNKLVNKNGKILRVTRFLDGEGKSLLSAISNAVDTARW